MYFYSFIVVAVVVVVVLIDLRLLFLNKRKLASFFFQTKLKKTQTLPFSEISILIPPKLKTHFHIKKRLQKKIKCLIERN